MSDVGCREIAASQQFELLVEDSRGAAVPGSLFLVLRLLLRSSLSKEDGKQYVFMWCPFPRKSCKFCESCQKNYL